MSLMGIMIVFALSYNMLLGETGMLSFGHAVYYGLGGFLVVHAMNLFVRDALPIPVMLVPLVGGLAGLAFGIIFGSVSTRDIAALIKADGGEVNRTQVTLNAPIKAIGQYKVPLALHPDVEISVTVTVARSQDEAERQSRGENVITSQFEEDRAADAQAAADMLEGGAGSQAPDRDDG